MSSNGNKIENGTRVHTALGYEYDGGWLGSHPGEIIGGKPGVYIVSLDGGGDRSFPAAIIE
jgi:hypothetical protein